MKAYVIFAHIKNAEIPSESPNDAKYFKSTFESLSKEVFIKHNAVKIYLTKEDAILYSNFSPIFEIILENDKIATRKFPNGNSELCYTGESIPFRTVIGVHATQQEGWFFIENYLFKRPGASLSDIFKSQPHSPYESRNRSMPSFSHPLLMEDTQSTEKLSPGFKY